MIDITTPPCVRNFDSINIPKIKCIHLPNGVCLNILDACDQDVCRVDLLFRGGKYEENVLGCASLSLSMLRKGTKKFSSDEISDILDRNGAWLSTSSSEHYSTIRLYTINRSIDKVLELLDDIVKNPIFPDSELRVLKNMISEAVKLSNEKTRYLASNTAKLCFYGAMHPDGKCITCESVESITRQDTVDFYNKVVNSENLEIFLSGNIKHNIIELIKLHFGDSRWGCDNNISLQRYDIESKLMGAPIIVNKDNSIQSSIIMYLNMPLRNSPDYIPLKILTTLLGGYFGSRLNMKLREEKGYTYGINAILHTRAESSTLQIITDCDVKYTYLSIAEIFSEIEKLKKEIIPQDELKMLKSYMISDLIKNVDTTFPVMDVYIAKIVTSIPDNYINELINELNNIDPNKLQEVAIKYFNKNNFIIVIAGDEKQLKKMQ